MTIARFIVVVLNADTFPYWWLEEVRERQGGLYERKMKNINSSERTRYMTNGRLDERYGRFARIAVFFQVNEVWNASF